MPRPRPQRPHRTPSSSNAALTLAALVLSGAQAAAGDPPSQEPFRVLDRVEGAHLDLALIPVRPMLIEPDSEHVFAVNAHDSTVVEFDSAGELVRTIRVPWGPVSLALWDPPWNRQSPFLLVVSRGSYTLTYIELSSGRIARLLDLPTEPADILVHPETGQAFVSCSGDDSVVEINVRAAEIVRTYPIDSKRPTFLAFDGDDVLVAPMLSGNNSIADTGDFILDAGPGRVLDLEDPNVAQQGLKDHDLFRITLGTDPVPVARDMGAVLFALGVNPVTGDLWQLGTEANNKDATRQGEPAIRGDIVVNQVAIAQLAGGSVVAPAAILNLDDTDPATAGVQFETERSVAQPYALDFDAAGDAYVAGLLSANVTQLTSTGAFVREWNVGSIPRAVLVAADGSEALVYSWGDNVIERWDLSNAAAQQTGTMDLGFDPTPADAREGRRLFFDASFSLHGNASCASCHVETESDMLPWDLSDLPFDDKGPLITQTMRGIEDLVPLHWRGERAELVDFNPAFDGLMGGRELDTSPGGEFDQFQAYIFSLEQPANPNTHPRRVVDGTPDANGGDAVRGQDIYFDSTAIPGIGSCNACHTMPTGTNNEVVLDEPDLEFARRTHFVVASYNGMWRKEQPTLEDVILADGTVEDRPTLGSGVSATGLKDSLLDFVEIDQFNLDPQSDRDVTAFVNQADSGLAPAVHRAWLLNQTLLAETRPQLRSYLMRQAAARNVDVAVFGSIDLGSGPRTLRWFWDRDADLMVPEDSSLAPVGLRTFFAAAGQGKAELVFLGLPVGMAKRFAADFDDDGILNGDEIVLGTDPENADSDSDGDADGHEVENGGDPTDPAVLASDTTFPVIENLRLVYNTARVAKIQFDTAEPTRVEAAWTSGAPSGTVSVPEFERNHTLILTNLRYNRLHTVTITAIDFAGNATTVDLPGGVRTLSSVVPDVILRNVSTSTIQNSAGTLHFTMTGRGRTKQGVGGISTSQLRVDVYVNGVNTQHAIGSISGTDGETTVEIIENGLTIGDEVRVVVDTVFVVQANTGTLWNLPETAPENREVTLIYDGTGP